MDKPTGKSTILYEYYDCEEYISSKYPQYDMDEFSTQLGLCNDTYFKIPKFMMKDSTTKEIAKVFYEEFGDDAMYFLSW